MNKLICFTGPSGSGKSTMAKFVSARMDIQYMEGSGYSRLLTDQQRDFLRHNWGYDGGGHSQVIRLSNLYPEFGLAFQEMVLSQRSLKFLSTDGDLVTDRSPIDNVVYSLLQNSHKANDEWFDHFIEAAQAAYKSVSHVIFIPCSNPSIEDNNSRVAKLYYQQMVSNTFEYVIKTYFSHTPGPKFLILPYWDLERRKKEVTEFLKPSQLEISI